MDIGKLKAIIAALITILELIQDLLGAFPESQAINEEVTGTVRSWARMVHKDKG